MARTGQQFHVDRSEAKCASPSISAHSAACWAYRPTLLMAEFRGPPLFPRSELQNFTWGIQCPLDLLIWLYWVVEETWQSCHCWGRIWLCHAGAVLLFSSELYKLCVQSITQYCGVNGAIVVTQEFVQARPGLFWGYGKERVDQQAHCLPGEMRTLIRQLESGGEWEESIH